MIPLLLSSLIAGLDQLTKAMIIRGFFPGESVTVIPGLLNLTYVRNTGAAWGMLGGLNGWLAVLSIVMLALIVVFRRSILEDVFVHKAALGFMIGGIVGNLIDRIRLLHVVDFLDFHWGPHHFPSFNVADSSICVGVGLYLLSSVWLASHPLHAARLSGPGAPPSSPPVESSGA